MREREPNIEADSSSILASEIAETINNFIGTQEWVADEPFELTMADRHEKLAYIYQIRKEENWITITEKISNNPSVVNSFLLNKKGSTWTYTDPYLIKYGESSIAKLQEIFNKLKAAIEASAPKKLNDKKSKLLTNES